MKSVGHLLFATFGALGVYGATYQPPGQMNDTSVAQNSSALFDHGKAIFRDDTFGDEAFWGGQLGLYKAILGKKQGGVGAGVSPKAALGLGLKVDASALPQSTVDAIKAGKVDLNDPAVTVALLKADAVVGVKGMFADGKLTSMGITCALCHSTVDDSFAPGIGNRLDGVPNQDLNVGAIIAASPNLKPLTNLLGVNAATVRKVLNSWGPGRFDAELILDGKAFRPDGKTGATLIPPALGLAGNNEHTWTGSWGSIPYWNAFVAVLEMHGQGDFFDPRLDNAKKYPVAAKARLGHVTHHPDLVTPKLAALQFYQLALPTPAPPAGSFNATFAAQGRNLFNGKARCASCHMPPTFTESGYNLHKAREIGIDDFQASRAPDDRYRTTPLRALWDTKRMHEQGFYHDGRFKTLAAVIQHYNAFFGLHLSGEEKRNLEQYLKSI